MAAGNIVWACQSLPLIVDHGTLNPALNDSSQWGFTLGNAVRVWRTGAGIDRHGNLVYAAANYQAVTSLAKILQRAGAVRAMQLDLNPEWPTLIAHAHHEGLDPMKIRPELSTAGNPLSRSRRPRLLRRLSPSTRTGRRPIPMIRTCNHG